MVGVGYVVVGAIINRPYIQFVIHIISITYCFSW
jgi:hypothetical protein